MGHQRAKNLLKIYLKQSKRKIFELHLIQHKHLQNIKHSLKAPPINLYEIIICN